MTKFKDGERHKCDDSCKSHVGKKKSKRVMGTSKKVLPKEETVESVTAELTIAKKELEDHELKSNQVDFTVDSEFATSTTATEVVEPTWQNVSELVIKGQIQHSFLEDLDFVLSMIDKSENIDAIKESKFHVEELTRKLNNIIRDKQIGL